MSQEIIRTDPYYQPQDPKRDAFERHFKRGRRFGCMWTYCENMQEWWPLWLVYLAGFNEADNSRQDRRR